MIQKRKILITIGLVCIPFMGITQIIKSKQFKLQPKRMHPVALKAIQKGIKPGTFKNVTVEYQDKVVFLQKKVKEDLRRKTRNQAILPVADLEKLNIHSNKIYLDTDSDLVFKPVEYGKDSLALIRPEMSEVFRELNIPLQRVPITIANTDYTINNTEVKDSQTEEGYSMKLVFKDTLYQFKKTIKKGKSTTKIDFKVRLDGFIGFIEPTVEAKYSKNNGYKLVFHAKEEMNLKAVSDLKLTEKMSFPIWGYDIPISDVGSCKIGVFIVFEADGEIHLEVGIQQKLQVVAGIQGKTFYYVPRSVKPVINFDKSYDIDYEVSGKLKAFAGVDVTAEIKFKSYAVLNIRTRGGVEMKVEFDSSKGSNFDAEIGARFLIDGKIKIKSYDKDFELYNKYLVIWKKEVKNTGGFILTIKDADVYHDRVWGIVYKTEKGDTIPFEGELTMRVKHLNNTDNTYQGSCNKQGVFALTEIPLVKGDQLFIKTEDSPSWSDAFEAKLPFSEIHLTYADYFTNTVVGSIASTVNYFPKNQNTNVPTTIIPKTNGVQIPQNNTIMKINTPKINIKIDRGMFKNLISYDGDVEIVSYRTQRKANRKGNRNIHNYKKKIPQINPNNSQINPNISQIKKITHLPFGSFKIENIDIKPGDKVKAKVAIDGFVLESNFVLSDGLIFSDIKDSNKQGGIVHETIKADDSYVVVNPFRSDQTLHGAVHLIKGIDMKHSSPKKDFPNQSIEIPKIAVFPQAIHPLVYFDKTVNFETMRGHTGFSIAHTGAWSIPNLYYNKRYIVSRYRPDGHRFEYIDYTFDNRFTGFKKYQRKCKMDNASYNILESKDKATPIKKIPNKNLGKYKKI